MEIARLLYNNQFYVVQTQGYRVRVLHNGKIYAVGEWRLGQYVEYAGDSHHGPYDWHLFDLIDKVLREHDLPTAPVKPASQSRAESMIDGFRHIGGDE